MYYVTTTDKFMSGWGQATGLINKLVILCDTYQDAEIVADNANNRDDQKHVGVSGSPPAYFHKRWGTTGSDYQAGNYYVQIKTRDDMPTWFKQGAFA